MTLRFNLNDLVTRVENVAIDDVSLFRNERCRTHSPTTGNYGALENGYLRLPRFSVGHQKARRFDYLN